MVDSNAGSVSSVAGMLSQPVTNTTKPQLQFIPREVRMRIYRYYLNLYEEVDVKAHLLVKYDYCHRSGMDCADIDENQRPSVLDFNFEKGEPCFDYYGWVGFGLLGIADDIDRELTPLLASSFPIHLHSMALTCLADPDDHQESLGYLEDDYYCDYVRDVIVCSCSKEDMSELKLFPNLETIQYSECKVGHFFSQGYHDKKVWKQADIEGETFLAAMEERATNEFCVIREILNDDRIMNRRPNNPTDLKILTWFLGFDVQILSGQGEDRSVVKQLSGWIVSVSVKGTATDPPTTTLKFNPDFLTALQHDAKDLEWRANSVPELKHDIDPKPEEIAMRSHKQDDMNDYMDDLIAAIRRQRAEKAYENAEGGGDARSARRRAREQRAEEREERRRQRNDRRREKRRVRDERLAAATAAVATAVTAGTTVADATANEDPGNTPNDESGPASDSDSDSNCTTEYEEDMESEAKSDMSVSDYIDRDDEFASVNTVPELQDLAQELGYSIFV